MDLSGFDATQQAEWKGDYEVLPDGEYVVVIDSTQEKQVKGKAGASYLEVKFQVIEGDKTGANLWTRLNLKNPSQQATSIAKAELAAICKAVGIQQPSVTEELHDIPLVLKVRTSEREDKPGQFRNEIKGYSPRQGNGTGSSVTYPPASVKAAGSAPWDNNKKTPF